MPFVRRDNRVGVLVVGCVGCSVLEIMAGSEKGWRGWLNPPYVNNTTTPSGAGNNSASLFAVRHSLP
jgi:hypothetical protein